jgi:uncharacterized membrane protein YedE/YeeE
MRSFSVFFTGWLFALGLGLGGMTQPGKIIGFLDVAGAWDPSLVFVMGGAVGFGLLAFAFILRRDAPIFGGSFQLPTKASLDWRLCLGAGLFGVGWGLSGYCPGPVLLALVTFDLKVVMFVLAMLAGMAIGQKLANS